eukprot:14380300-Alexandrium_andersonii.AAC.1
MDDQEHKLRQLSGWSDTPEHDNAAIDTAVGPFQVFCRLAPGCLDCVKVRPSNYKPDAKMNAAIAEMTNSEATRPKLV